MGVNLTLSIKRRFLLDLRPSAKIGQAAGNNLLALNETWGPQDQPVPNQADYDPNDNTLLCVLKTPLTGVQKFSTRCDWLTHVADHIFGPLGTVHHPNGQAISEIEQLEAVDYVFEPMKNASRSIFLMRYFVSPRPKVPAPDKPQGFVKTALSNYVTRRENQLCKISGADRGFKYNNICSHLIPKRLGPYVVQHIMVRLTGSLPDWGTAPLQWDPSVAVLLYAQLDNFVDGFTMGFYGPVPPNITSASRRYLSSNILYQVHQFEYPFLAASQNQNNMRGWTKLALRGETIVANNLTVWENQIATLNLHGSTVYFPVGKTNNVSNPPFHVLGWHYTQCVMRKWSTQAYKNYPNINW